MTRTWLSIRVELVEGRGERLWPRPGRIFAAARRHTFADLATAIDDAFARWDRAHLHEFHLTDGTRLTTPDGEEDEDELGPSFDDRRTKLSRLGPGEQFLYAFDLGDNWTHLCTVGSERIDPYDELGVEPDVPLAYWGWGAMPDQYGRRWDGDDGEGRMPRNPRGADLPPLRPGWGPCAAPLTAGPWAIADRAHVHSSTPLVELCKRIRADGERRCGPRRGNDSGHLAAGEPRGQARAVVP